jgi:hypothetical protein
MLLSMSMRPDVEPIPITAKTMIDGENLMHEIEALGLSSAARYQIHHSSSPKIILDSSEK